ELIDARSDNRLPSNWADSTEPTNSDWTTVAYSGVLTNGDGTSINMLEIILLGEGECLLDDLEVIGPTSTNNLVSNPGFETGLTGWFLEGNHDQSILYT